ncbi:hypothetical protein IWX90DRAFT_211239 [Phyllosticta citrichinensis]|uniref:PIPK domain-containing protein n=1 Tax=Phyllosticta citrichinensis TaxID=1130410 RepID=A0ABR1XTD3_9PEZI
MGFRDARISRSIIRAIFHQTNPKDATLVGRILAFFSFLQLLLIRFRPRVFDHLRKDVWKLDEDEYRESFRSADKSGGALKPVGDLGYSGSTFFTTPNTKFLIKSLPRAFEYEFFMEDLWDKYVEHMTNSPNSLLVRITDFLEAIGPAIGSWIGTAPAHHVVMENVLYGKETDEQQDKWETYDLKPPSYFYPERDIAGGRLAPDSVKERLVDHFPDKMRLSPHDHAELIKLLEADTALLRSANAVDYSLFLVRYPAEPTREVSSPAANERSWRSGVLSRDGKWVYRAVVLDFFWAKHKTQPKLMTKLIRSFNFFAHKGPMSITTTPDEYRGRFLEMVQGYIEASE